MTGGKERGYLKNLNQDYYNPAFSHIYVEQRVMNHWRTKKILQKLPHAQVIFVTHYKDIFNRKGQKPVQQQKSQSLILAAKEDHFFYEGSPLCQNFGNENFYYCSTIMNCVYDCSYCYLKGMYPSGHMVVFVNLEDYFEELKQLLQKKSIYLCVSYDADLLAVEPLAGYARLWAEFAAKHEKLKLEIRTKSARGEMWQFPGIPNVIYAFTLSPQQVICQSENKTPSEQARVECMMEGLKKGFPVRLCFDPMLYLPEWKLAYTALFMRLDAALQNAGKCMNDFTDVSVGTFRISKDYLKRLRQQNPDSAVVQFPFVTVGGICQYPQELLEEMENFMRTELEKRMDREKIFYE